MGCTSSHSVPVPAALGQEEESDGGLGMMRAKTMSGSTTTLLLSPAPGYLPLPPGAQAADSADDSRPVSAQTVVMGPSPEPRTADSAAGGVAEGRREREDHTDRVLKILLLGDTQVGKTKLASACLGKTFSSKYLPTSNVDFVFVNVPLQRGGEVGVQIWDMSGTYRSDAWPCPYAAELCDGAVVVADLTRAETFKAAEWWLDDCRARVAAECRSMPVLLLANKADLAEDSRLGPFAEIESLAADKGFLACVRISAADRRQPAVALRTLVESILSAPS